jgi:hypothetical protein
MPSRVSNAALTVDSREARDIEISLDFLGTKGGDWRLLSGFEEAESRILIRHGRA